MYYRTVRIAVIALSIAAPLTVPAFAQTGRAPKAARPPASAHAEAPQPKSWLGVEVKSLTRADAENPAKRIAAGAQVIGIADGSPAVSILANGDILLTVDGKSINSAKTFFSALAPKEPGTSVKVGISRAGKKIMVSVTLATRPDARPAATSADAQASAPTPAAEAPAPQQAQATEPAKPDPAPQAEAAPAPSPAPAASAAQADTPQPQQASPAPALAEPQKNASAVQPGRAPVYSGTCDGVLVVSGLPGKSERYCMKPGGGSLNQSFRDCPTCPEMLVVPSGSFTMGSAPTEAGDADGAHNDRESPQHLVVLPRAFAVGRFAVTFDEWDACVADKGCPDDPKRDREGWGRGRRPVVNVTWAEAKAYTKWLSKKTGRPYRLLSEAEREYVARAGTTSPYWWGATMTTTQANFSMDQTVNGEKRFNDEPDGKFREQTVLVDEFKPNPWGLYQVHGNIWEWVEDCRHDSYKGKPDALTKNGGAWIVGDCFYRMQRGGGWNNLRFSSRSAARGFADFDESDNNTGFRVAREIQE